MRDQRPRIIGAVWLLYFVTGIVGSLLAQGGIIAGNTAGALTNILAHPTQYRAGVAVGLFANALYVVLTALLYDLFAPVNRGLSLTAAFLSLVGCTVQIVATMLQLAPISLLRDSALAGVFTTDGLRAAALMSLKLWAQSFQISIVMFAMFEVVLGYLIYKSSFTPRAFGILLLLAGLVSMTYFWPPFFNTFRYVALPFAGLAEIPFPMWLFVRGVDGVARRPAGT
jgi:Domain of unknown function (DUF4386)